MLITKTEQAALLPAVLWSIVMALFSEDYFFVLLYIQITPSLHKSISRAKVKRSFDLASLSFIVHPSHRTGAPEAIASLHTWFLVFFLVQRYF